MSDSKENKLMIHIGKTVKASLPEGFGFTVLCYKLKTDGNKEIDVLFASDTSINFSLSAMQGFIDKYKPIENEQIPKQLN